jgi:hypothetical protein
MLERVLVAGLSGVSLFVAWAHLLKPSECPVDDRLIERVALSSPASSSAWWEVTRASLKSSGVDVDDAQAVLEVVNIWLAADHKNLNIAIDALLDNARAFDVNGTGFVCVYDVKGSRRTAGEPFSRHYVHGISDDRADAP